MVPFRDHRLEVPLAACLPAMLVFLSFSLPLFGSAIRVPAVLGGGRLLLLPVTSTPSGHHFTCCLLGFFLSVLVSFLESSSAFLFSWVNEVSLCRHHQPGFAFLLSSMADNQVLDGLSGMLWGMEVTVAGNITEGTWCSSGLMLSPTSSATLVLKDSDVCVFPRWTLFPWYWVQIQPQSNFPEPGAENSPMHCLVSQMPFMVLICCVGRTLLQQLQKLQTLVMGKVSRTCKLAGTQTGTCLMVSFPKGQAHNAPARSPISKLSSQLAVSRGQAWRNHMAHSRAVFLL